ncbi:hypothetical protein BSNT_07640 [Bacillus subtilis subsp. natto BEST195]|nr:hypothetical protein BSNT_07640 [Bacillus subtilis subsp. natto BEST195]
MFTPEEVDMERLRLLFRFGYTTKKRQQHVLYKWSL